MYIYIYILNMYKPRLGEANLTSNSTPTFLQPTKIKKIWPSILLKSCAQQRFSFAPCHSRVRVPGGQSCVRDSRLFSPSRQWNIPPSLVPSRVLAESQGKIWLKVGRSGVGMASGVKQWSPRQWVEFVGQNFFSPSPIALEKATAIFMLQGEMNYEM